jgi:hypothetical protein
MADNRTVHHDEQGFGDQGPEGGQREGDDLPVVAAPYGCGEAGGLLLLGRFDDRVHGQSIVVHK